MMIAGPRLVFASSYQAQTRMGPVSLAPCCQCGEARVPRKRWPLSLRAPAAVIECVRSCHHDHSTRPESGEARAAARPPGRPCHSTVLKFPGCRRGGPDRDSDSER
jgi:hypothetical protein